MKALKIPLNIVTPSPLKHTADIGAAANISLNCQLFKWLFSQWVEWLCVNVAGFKKKKKKYDFLIQSDLYYFNDLIMI